MQTAALAFDTHEAVKRLQAAGFTLSQAEAQTDIVKELVESQLASKQDLAETEAKLMAEFAKVDANLRVEIANSKTEIIKWVLGISLAQFGALATLLLNTAGHS